MNGNQDGVDDFVAGRSNCLENYNGRWEPGEEDVAPTLIVEDEQAPNKSGPFPFIYVASHTTEQEKASHRWAWGDEMGYSFVQGAKPIRSIKIAFPEDLKVSASPEVISFTRTDPGLRASCRIRCLETEMQSHPITIITTYMDDTSGSLVTDMDIGPPKPIPFTRSKKGFCGQAVKNSSKP